MRSLFGVKRTPIGIDIGSRCVKAVQLSRTRHGWRVEAATIFAQQQFDSPLDGVAIRRIAGILARQGFDGCDVVLGVPQDKLESGTLELPSRSSGAPVEQIAQVELARTLKAVPGTLAVDMWEVPAPARASGGTHVMAVALRNSDADALTDAFENAGLNLCSLDIHAWAEARACAALARTTPGSTAVLDIGWNGSRLVLIHGDNVIYQRALQECGIHSLHMRIVEALELDGALAEHVLNQVILKPIPDSDRTDPMLWASIRMLLSNFIDAVRAELQTSFSYAAHRYPDHHVDKLFLTGGGASITDLPQQLAEGLEIPVKVLVPADIVECPADLLPLCGSPALIPAVGLAQLGEG